MHIQAEKDNKVRYRAKKKVSGPKWQNMTVTEESKGKVPSVSKKHLGRS